MIKLYKMIDPRRKGPEMMPNRTNEMQLLLIYCITRVLSISLRVDVSIKLILLQCTALLVHAPLGRRRLTYNVESKHD